MIGEVFEFGSEGGAEHVNIAEIGAEAGAEAEAGDRAGAEAEVEPEAEVVPEPKSVVEPGFVVSAYDTFHKLSSGAAVAWGSGVSLGAVFEPMVGFVLAAASEAEDKVAPFENMQGARSEAQA